MRIAGLTILTSVLCVSSAMAAGPFGGMVEITLDERKIEGKPLAWNDQLVSLLGRDGRLWQFRPDEADDFRKTSDRFRSYTVSQLRAMLLRDLGRRFEVSGTTHYLVAHPRGQRDKWAQRFDDLYRSFVHYFSVRGFKPVKPPFPLIGIVCRDRRDFARYSAKQGLTAPDGVLGYYALDSNHIILYDMGAKDKSQGWQYNASVIIHEATHQMAFNTGIHSRYAQPPLWVIEGLATMFEAPGVYDSRYHKQRSDRINHERFDTFKQMVAPRHRPELLASLIASDRFFRTNPAAAYAEAWALTFYLAETRARKYTKYLARTANRPPFAEYTPAERTADFTVVFGDNWPMLEARFLRFMKEVE